MCRYAFQRRVHPPRIGRPAAAGAFSAFLRDRRGAVTLDWMTLAAGAAGLAALVIAAISWLAPIDGAALAARAQADASAKVVAASGVARIDPGTQLGPGAPVFDPGGRDPGATAAPPTLPVQGGAAPDTAPGRPGS